MTAEVESPIDIETRLHERMLAGDPLATADIYDLFSGRIISRLKSRYRKTEPELVEEAFLQTLFDYFRRPDRYDPTKRSLRGYLSMAAERDLQTLDTRSKRHQDVITQTSDIELDTQSHSQWQSGGDIGDALADEETAAKLSAEMMAVAQTEEERIVQELRMAEERSTAVYADALGWHGLSLSEQQAQLYRIKNRLDKRLRRRKATS